MRLSDSVSLSQGQSQLFRRASSDRGPRPAAQLHNRSWLQRLSSSCSTLEQFKKCSPNQSRMTDKRVQVEKLQSSSSTVSSSWGYTFFSSRFGGTSMPSDAEERPSAAEKNNNVKLPKTNKNVKEPQLEWTCSSVYNVSLTLALPAARLVLRDHSHVRCVEG